MMNTLTRADIVIGSRMAARGPLASWSPVIVLDEHERAPGWFRCQSTVTQQVQAVHASDLMCIPAGRAPSLPSGIRRTPRPSPGELYRAELDGLASATAYNLSRATAEWQRRDVLALHRQWTANARRRYQAAVIREHIDLRASS
jgi:hypothetical protein